MDRVSALALGVERPDGARLGLLGVRSTDQIPESLDGALATEFLTALVAELESIRA